MSRFRLPRRVSARVICSESCVRDFFAAGAMLSDSPFRADARTGGIRSETAIDTRFVTVCLVFSEILAQFNVDGSRANN